MKIFFIDKKWLTPEQKGSNNTVLFIITLSCAEAVNRWLILSAIVVWKKCVEWYFEFLKMVLSLFC